MIEFLQVILLGIVQGITEWLPISSSGHLILLQDWFGIKEEVIYTAVLHFASLIALIIVFRKSIFKILKSFLYFDFGSRSGKLGLYIIIGTIPIVVVGLLFFDFFEKLFRNGMLLGVAFLVNGVVLLFSESFEKDKPLSFGRSFFIGLIQVVSIIPGISRSGITISAGLLHGVKKEDVAEYSFLLAFPLIIGGFILSLIKVEFVGNLLFLFVGGVVSFVVSLVSLKYLLKLIRERKFHYFGFYCLILGLLVMFLNILKF